ncbi:hypothetical protein GUITHDRAFT_151852 [Guillardia theta CCMP2712]|uniref:Uncharacterized protein n=1 Tax=Guillardia theta (strain CCMP2712) TaxID=905079 RepID=L1JIJ0_GUITC|nr:hypothetical protein GUITHDRAFT_151852 [Guillardia theta CCMP2712]EKX48291.1 hypothetical protein GUITHDRAFT_151852 [Guillardia theta CCMP2712]|mmetsp:Transcript_29837/g.95431  ORF Transcript_29837/g.95431 Transcript_29837/m.95431 type:complete len:129 (-) Transcript_29837:447-833(-)|eukprot:XP_005835271.1 hypothetical protein GUITHDRAFT_151852 [Guillardia theta CCMP2712]
MVNKAIKLEIIRLFEFNECASCSQKEKNSDPRLKLELNATPKSSSRKSKRSKRCMACDAQINSWSTRCEICGFELELEEPRPMARPSNEWTLKRLKIRTPQGTREVKLPMPSSALDGTTCFEWLSMPT